MSHVPESKRLDLDDPRLSAYALGEMDESERTAFEALLENDSEARTEVEAIRALGGDLEQAFSKESTLALRPEQKAAIASAAAAPAANGGRDVFGRLVGWAVAAVVLIGVPVLSVTLGGGGGGRGFRTPSNDLTLGRLDQLENTAKRTGEAGSRGYVPKPEGDVVGGEAVQPATLEEVSEEALVTEASGAATKPRDAAGPDLPVLTDGLSDAPFERPGTSGTIGVGGGSGGAFGGRRGKHVGSGGGGVSGGAFFELPAPVPLADPSSGSGPASTRPALAEAKPPIGTDGVSGLGAPPRGAGTLAENKRVLSVALAEIDRLTSTRKKMAPAWTGEHIQLYGYTVEMKPDVVAGLRLYSDALNAGDAQLQQRALRRLRAAKIPQPVFARLRVTSPQPTGTETYQPLIDNPFKKVATDDVSTFSIDVDTASYANVRRMIFQQNRLPAPDAVRIEEFINAFDYGYARPTDDRPLAMRGDVAGCPWNPHHRLARVTLQAKDVGEDRPMLNLVFLIDVSGSMKDSNKLPLVKRGLSMLLENLKDSDRVGVVTYSNTAQVRLESTVANEYSAIQNVINGLVANGSTNGAGGIQMAYAMARRHFVKGASNRVILLTDGDFNVGISDDQQLEQLIAQEAQGGIDLSVLGFGMGNYKDGKLERLSNRGNGNYAYIDTADEARKALVDDMLGTLVTVARDVKIQVFFNPRTVRQWRLIGYANRQLAARDFNDDTKDAGEVGSGHAVTAFYEIVPVGAPTARNEVDPNPFKGPAEEKPQPSEAIAADSSALFQLRLRFKRPDQDTSELVEVNVEDADAAFDQADDDFQFATAAAGLGLVLRQSRYAPGLTLSAVEEIAKGVAGEDKQRKEFLALVAKARALGSE